VIVVGGGPIGSHVACQLAGMGHGVVVLERKQGLGEKVCCTGIIGQECVNSFAIDDRVILKRVNSARLFSPAGEILRVWREETQACILDRAAFDMSMAARAQDRGVEYIFDCPVADIAIGTDGVRVGASRRGKECNFEARAVVIANGFSAGLCQ